MSLQLNRIELDSVKKQLEARWKNIKERLQAQEPLEHGDAAVLRKCVLISSSHSVKWGGEMKRRVCNIHCRVM